MEISDDIKDYLKKLFPRKRLLFKTITEGGYIINLGKENLLNYDYIVTQLESKNCYVICIADLHIGNKTTTLSMIGDYYSATKIVAITKRININGRNTDMYEKYFVIPMSQIEKFAEHDDEYFDTYKAVNNTGKITYGFYNRETKKIERKEK